MDAIKFLTRQHREVEALFRQYEQSPSKGRALFGKIERAIIPHAVIEEMYVYPVLRERVAQGETLSEHAIHEHAQVEQTLNLLGSMTPASIEFDGAMREVVASVRQHVDEEERPSGLFSMLRATLNQRELDEMGRNLRQASETTPTRAHPLAPDHPPANKLLGLPLAAVDRIRDRISGRAEASEPAERRVRRAAPRKRRATKTKAKPKPKRATARRRKATAKRIVRRRARGRATRARRR